MKKNSVTLFPNLTTEVVEDISGFKLCSYLVALEGWRRGLTLKWYKDETDLCKLDKLNSSTHGKFFSLKSGDNTHFFFRSRGDFVSNKAVRICQNKEKTKKLLEEHGVPIPKGTVCLVEDENAFLKFAKKVGYPVVIKPLNGSMGKGVFTNIKDKHELKNALQNARSNYNYVEYIIEKYYPGNEYRIYVVGDNVIAATKRIPANVVGDGKSTVKELIARKNMERKKNPYLSPKPIKVDYEVEMLLKKANYTLDDILPKGKKVFLRMKSNLSSGGDPIEANEDLSDEIKKIAVEALKAIPSLPHAGIDIIVDPKNNKKGVVLEINATAEIAFHLFPIEGKARNVPGGIIDYYFPETKGQPKSNFYFNYNNLLQPLKNWDAEEIVVVKPPIGKIYGRKLIVTGKVNKVGYMNWTRRQALTRGFHGYIKKVNKSTMEILVISDDLEKIREFGELCYKGSKKSRVDNIEFSDVDIQDNEPIKMGFQLIL